MYKTDVIKDYCRRHLLNIKDFSDDFNLSTLYQYNKGYRRPSVKAIKKLEQATNGEINYYSFFPKSSTNHNSTDTTDTNRETIRPSTNHSPLVPNTNGEVV